MRAFRIQYVYNTGHNNGRVAQTIDNTLGETVNYSCDYLHRLTAATATNGSWGEAYAYDGFGNLTGKTPTQGYAPAMTGSADSNATGGALNGQWDVEKRPMTQSTSFYVYDPWGRRIWKQWYNSQYGTNNCEAYFYGATGQKLESYSCIFTNGAFGATLQGINTYFAGKMLSEKGVFIATDRLGSVRGDSNGVSMSYYPWGEERGQGTTDNRTKFAGYYRDMPGQDYAMARYYSASTGNFWSPDPGGVKTADSSDPTSWNRYSYVGSDPMNHTDPGGMIRDDQCGPGWQSDPSLEGPCCDPSANGFLGMAPDPACYAGGGGGASEGEASPGTDCNALVAAVGFAGLTYANASEIWSDGNLSAYSTDATAATIGALAAVTWQGESGFSLSPINNPNRNDAGAITSVDYGPFQINQHFHPNSNGAVWGSNGAGQKFNGNPDANIAFGIQVLEGLYKSWGNAAAGHYVGSLGTGKDGKPTLGQRRQNTWNTWGAQLTSLFSNTDCFPHQ